MKWNEKATQKGKEIKENFPKAKEDPLTSTGIVIFFSDAVLFFLLIFIPVPEQSKVLIFLIYFLSSLLLIFLVDLKLFRKKAAVKKYMTSPNNVRVYIESKRLIYYGPPIVTFFIIYYYITSLNLNSTLVSLPLFTVSINTLILFAVVAHSQGSFAYRILSYVSGDFDFYICKHDADCISSFHTRIVIIKCLSSVL